MEKTSPAAFSAPPLAVTLSLVAAILLALVALAGLLFPAVLYPTTELRQAFLANDIVSLVIAVPVLLVAVLLSRDGRLM